MQRYIASSFLGVDMLVFLPIEIFIVYHAGHIIWLYIPLVYFSCE